MNKTAMRLVPRLDKERKRQVASYLAESEKLFAAGKLARSKAILKKARIMAPDNDRIEELIKKVQLRQDIGYLLKLARDRVRQHDSRKGVIYASRILSLEPTHHEAREILSQVLQARQAKPPLATTPIPEQREFISALATIRQLCLAEKNDEEAAKLARLAENGLQQEVFVMLERGQALYAQKAFADAQAIFEYVDEIDPGNELAQAFIKKIENRLETLDSLQ
jgi:tetratricopeptide (TPR) repeat protein